MLGKPAQRDESGNVDDKAMAMDKPDVPVSSYREWRQPSASFKLLPFIMSPRKVSSPKAEIMFLLLG